MVTWTLVQSNSINNDAPGTLLSVTLTNPVTSGNLVAITVSWADVSAATVDDTIGNTYTILDPQDDPGPGQSSGGAGTVNITNGPQTFRLHNNPATSFRDITVEEWNCSTGPSAGIDKHAGATTLNVAANAGFSAGTVVTTVDGCLIWSCTNSSTASTPALAGSGFVRNNTVGGEATESQTQTTAGSVTGAWVNVNATESYMANMIAFKPASLVVVGK